MLLFIVPVFDGLFKSLAGELPVPTQILVGLSNIIKIAGIPFIIGIGVFIWWWRNNKNKRNIREFVDPIKLKIPVFGKLNQLIIMSRFARNMAALIDAAVPLLQILENLLRVLDLSLSFP